MNLVRTLNLLLVALISSPLAAEEHSAAGAWLGVQLSPVPSALRSHLELDDDSGVMIRNVVTNSPADKAGLQRYDVVVQVDEQPVDQNVEAFSKHVRDHQPGETIQLSVRRHAQPEEVSVTLAEQPANWDSQEWKFGDDPDVAHWRDMGLRGRILRHGPEGWLSEDLGELDFLKDMPDIDHFIESFGKPHDRGQKDETVEARKVIGKDEVLHVRRDKDGQFTVRRESVKDDVKHVETNNYDTIEALREADSEAAELIESMKPDERPVYMWHSRPLIRPHVEPIPPGIHVIPKQEEWANRFFRAPHSGNWTMPVPPTSRGAQDHTSRRPTTPPLRVAPKYSFEVGPDGRIQVQVRNEDSELKMTFDSEANLEKDAPELYEAYRNLRR